MNILKSEDLFIFNLLTPEETALLIAVLSRYASECAENHDSEFINTIENERVRAAFTYFDNKFRRRRPRRKQLSKPGKVKSEIAVCDDVVKLPQKNPRQQLTEAISDSRTSFRKAMMVHCPWLGTRYKPKNREYNVFRARPSETAALILELDAARFPDSAGPYLLSRLTGSASA